MTARIVRLSETQISFHDEAVFGAMSAMRTWLMERGFAVGPSQAGSPIGVMFGNYTVSKWRNLRAADRAELHGTVTGDGRYGPLLFTLRGPAPDEAREAIKANGGAA